VLLVWQFLYAGPKLKVEQERRQRVQLETQATPQAQTQTQTQAANPAAALPTTAAAAPAATREAALAESPRVPIATPSLKGSIALKGGRIDDLVLVKYRETVDKDSPNVELFSPSGAPAPYYAEFGWVPGGGVSEPLPGRDTLWTVASGSTLTPSSPVTLEWANGQGLRFRRTMAIDPDYLITVTDSVENTGSGEVMLYPYALISRHGLPPTRGYYILHEGLIGVLGDAGLQEITYADAMKEGGAKSFHESGGWLGITDKYWAAALIPNQTTPYEAEMSGAKAAVGGKERFQTGYTLGAITLPPGAQKSATNNLFAGAKQVTLVEAYRDKLGAKKFDLLIDWGWFFFITKPLFKLLHWLSQMLGNYGLAVLATTVLVKAAFFPLANKSYESMAKMKKLQPEMEKIRARFKDDRMRQQQEMMALYKNQKINPMAGCLPMALQVPVFFALYKVLFVTIDMRQAPFFGWIKDLSAPDPTSVFNLFGLLPFTVPEYLHIGVWPLIMGATMWMQMQLNPQQPDPIQQKLFNWMPVIFTFMLASFPSGLVIYWAWNNVLSLLQQYAIMRRNNAEIHLWKNLGKNFGVEHWRARVQRWFGGAAGPRPGSQDAAAEPANAAGSARLSELTARASQVAAQLAGRLADRFARGGTGQSDQAARGPNAPMTREDALRTLGLKLDATPGEIETALRRRSGRGLNRLDAVRGADIDAACELLRGKEGS
jgi:YidC/Oxa1 family membrane protein insertase